MNPPRFTAEAAVYRPREAYRTIPVARHDTAASITPATAADRIDGHRPGKGLHHPPGVRNAEAKADVASIVAGHSWTPERADAGRGEVQKMASSATQHEDRRRRGARCPLDFQILDIEA